jgi:hypothetical protein
MAKKGKISYHCQESNPVSPVRIGFIFMSEVLNSRLWYLLLIICSEISCTTDLYTNSVICLLTFIPFAKDDSVSSFTIFLYMNE